MLTASHSASWRVRTARFPFLKSEWWMTASSNHRSQARALHIDSLIWISNQFRNENGKRVSQWLGLDPATGEMLGRVSLNCLGHELAVSPGGALLPGLLCPDSTGHVVLYRRRD